MKRFKNILTIIFLFVLYMYIASITQIPKEIILLKGEKFKIKKLKGIEVIQTATTSSTNIDTINIQISLLGKIPVKDINVNIIENAEVIPIGKIIGLKLYTNGVLVVGMSEIENINNQLEKPFENTDIKEGDTIIKINENEIENIEDLKKKGYKYVTLGVEPNETRNMMIYFHYGFREYIKSGMEFYPNGAEAFVLYYKKSLIE